MTLTGSRGPAGTRHPGRTVGPVFSSALGEVPQGGGPKAEDDQTLGRLWLSILPRTRQPPRRRRELKCDGKNRIRGAQRSCNRSYVIFARRAAMTRLHHYRMMMMALRAPASLPPIGAYL